MPRIEDIEQFNEQLTQLGDEPRIAAARGEEIENPRPASENREAGVAPSRRAAQGDSGSEAAGAGEGAEGGAPAEGGAAAAGEAGAPQGAEGAAEAGDSAAGGTGGEIDDELADLLGDEGEEASEEDDPFAGIDLDFDDDGDEGWEGGESEDPDAGEPFATDDEPAQGGIGEDDESAEADEDADEFDLGGLDDLDWPDDEDSEAGDAEEGDAEEPAEPEEIEGVAEAEAEAETEDALTAEDLENVEDAAEDVEDADEDDDDFDLDSVLAGLDEDEEGEAEVGDAVSVDDASEGAEDASEGAEPSDDDDAQDEFALGDDLDVASLDANDEFSFEDEPPAFDEGDFDEPFGEPEEEVGEGEELEADEAPQEIVPAEEDDAEGEAEDEDFSFGDDVLDANVDLDDEGDDDFGFGDESGDDDSDDFGDVDEFSLGDFGSEFGVIEEGDEPQSEEELNPASAPPSGRPQAEGTDAGPGINLNDTQFRHLKETLNSLPLNLRTAVEDVIGSGEFDEEEVTPLVDQLVEGAAPKQIARTTGRIKGEIIRLPRNYEVRRGVVFEDQKATFAWQFRHRFLPIARTAIIVAALVVGAIYTGVRYVYQPLYARSLYLQGLEEIEEDRYSVGNEFFDEARLSWENEEWFYRYADAFIGKRQYRLAQEKFEQLLARYPGDREGLLRYGDFESRILGDYPKADELFDAVLDQDVTDYDGLLGRADNFLRWADQDSGRFEDARFHYARLFELYGGTDEIYQRFMRYFVRTDNLGEVERIAEMFEEARPEAEIDPEIYAESAGYLLDYNRIDYIRQMLTRARTTDPRVPDVHYQLARFFESTGERDDRETALSNARNLFPAFEPLSRRRLAMHIDTYTLSGEFYADGAEYLTAEQYYAEAIDRYEEARASNLVDIEERFGRMYAGLGDIYYYESAEYEAARAQFLAAEQNAYSTDDSRYKLGWIAYRNEDYDEAVDRFESVANSPQARNIRYALANTHYYRGNYFASQTYLRELLEILRQERQRIGLDFNVDQRTDHRRIIKYKVMANNNLGVVMHRLFEHSGDRERRGDALYYLTNSTQDATNLLRDPDTAVRADSTDLAYLNQQYVLFPDQPYTLRIYRDLPVDLEDGDFFPAEL